MIDSVNVLDNYTNWSYSLVDEELKIPSQFRQWAENWFVILLLGLIQYDIMDTKYWSMQKNDFDIY